MQFQLTHRCTTRWRTLRAEAWELQVAWEFQWGQALALVQEVVVVLRAKWVEGHQACPEECPAVAHRSREAATIGNSSV